MLKIGEKVILNNEYFNKLQYDKGSIIDLNLNKELTINTIDKKHDNIITYYLKEIPGVWFIEGEILSSLKFKVEGIINEIQNRSRSND
jgi:hypothetical protein